MLLSSLNTGSTDLRDTEVQQPNTAATFSLVISSRAFSANSGQLDAGSTTTGSSFLPSSPPFLFWASIIIRTVSFSVVSLMAMVPDSECRTPTLMVSCPKATFEKIAPAENTPVAATKLAIIPLRFIAFIPSRNLVCRILHLKLDANSSRPEVSLTLIEAGLPHEGHDPGIELLDQVVDIPFRGFLVVAGQRAVGEIGLGVLRQQLHLSGAGSRRQDIRRQPIGTLALGVFRIVTAQAVVVGVLAFQRNHAFSCQFSFQQKIDGGSGGAILYLCGATEGE